MQEISRVPRAIFKNSYVLDFEYFNGLVRNENDFNSKLKTEKHEPHKNKLRANITVCLFPKLLIKKLVSTFSALV